MARRLPASPPVLAGFTHIHALGAGGFADVHLYEQNMPRRRVAVKVMRSDLVDDAVRSMFQAEVNLMGQLSDHPAILTVYQASVSNDGRPYLVMELCSSEIGGRYRDEPLSVPEVLDIGVRIGSALETAHRAGTLHRDVKPQNIMTTSYGHPVLSDFGIAAQSSAQSSTVGVSVPWSAPEVLSDESAGTIASEVYAFAATLYSLVEGRSPAEIPGGLNGQAQLIDRIVHGRIQPMTANVPPRLRAAIERALSTNPDDRQPDVATMLSQLQEAQVDLGLVPTPIEIAMDEWAAAYLGDVEDRTIAADSVVSAAARARGRSQRALLQGERVQVVSSPTGDLGPTSRRPQTALRIGIAAAGLLAVAAIVVAALAWSSLSGQIPRVEHIEAVIEGDEVIFDWNDPGLFENDSFQVRTNDGLSIIQSDSQYAVLATPGDVVCITVAVNRDGQTGDPSPETCIEVPE